MLGGLAVAANGLRLVPSETRFDAGTTTDWTLQIVDDDSHPVVDFDDTHGQRSHLIVVRRDLTPVPASPPELASDRTWRVEDL